MWRYEPKTDDEYIGNVWGWKFSMFGLALIVGLSLAAYLVAESRGINIFDGNEVMPIEQSAPVQQTSK
jgi:hypothetical protein